MGQEFAQRREWCEKRSLDWDLLDEEEHQQIQKYVKDLIRFYKDYPALYREDFDSEGFEWISAQNADDSILTFMRKSDKPGEDLFVVVNFTPVLHEDYLLGVPYAGKYKETFNSDNTIYGGQGNVNPRAKQSKKEKCDGREDSIRVTIPPLGISVYQCTKAAPEKKAKTAVEEKAAGGKKAAGTKKAEKAGAKTAKETKETKTSRKGSKKVKAEPVEETKAELEPELEAVQKAEAEPELEAVQKAESELEAVKETKAELKPEPEAVQKAKAEPELEAEKETKADSELKPVEAETEPEPEKKPRRGRSKKVAEPEPEAEKKPRRGRSKKVTETEPEPEKKPRRGRSKKMES
jgi:1,4-alpha-glucan branching enzyme